MESSFGSFFESSLAKLSDFIEDVIGFYSFSRVADTNISEHEDQKLFNIVIDPNMYNLIRDKSLAGDQAKISRFVEVFAGDTIMSIYILMPYPSN